MDVVVSNGMNEELLVDFDLDSLTEEWQKNSSWSISFDVMKTRRNAFTFDLLQNESEIIFNGQHFVIKGLDPKASGSISLKKISAPHIYFTCQDHRQYEKKSKTWTIEEAMHWAFDGNTLGFTFEIIGIFSNVQIDNFGDSNGLDMLNTILQTFGAVVEADNKHLILYSESSWGLVTDKQIRYQYNTDEISMSMDTSKLKTVIRGYGKQNEDGSYIFPPVTYTSPNAKKYGERHADPIRDDRFIYADSMTEYLKTQLNDEPEVSLTVPLKVKEDVGRGEHRLLIYEPMDIDIDLQVIAYKKYPISNKAPEVTFSNKTKDIIDVMSGFSSTQKSVGKVIGSNGMIKEEALGTDISKAVQKINSVITDNGSLDLNKSEGRLPDEQTSIGPQTIFSPGYDPTQIEITKYELVTQTEDGLMSHQDKIKLDGLNEEGQTIPSATETNDGLMSKEHFIVVNSIPKNGQGTAAFADEVGNYSGGLMSFIQSDKLYDISKETNVDKPDFPFYNLSVYIAYAFQAIDQGLAEGSVEGNGYYYLSNLLEMLARKVDEYEYRISTLEG